MEKARFPLWKNIHSVFWKDTSSPRFVTKPTCSVAQHALLIAFSQPSLAASTYVIHVTHDLVFRRRRTVRRTALYAKSQNKGISEKRISERPRTIPSPRIYYRSCLYTLISSPGSNPQSWLLDKKRESVNVNLTCDICN